MSATYFGSWELIPELCHYSKGKAPDAALYQIDDEGERIAFTISWTADGQDQTVSFAPLADGTMEEAEVNMPAHRIIPVSDSQLDGEAFIGDRRIATASRRVSMDGTLLSVLQVNEFVEGEVERVFQVYRRREE